MVWYTDAPTCHECGSIMCRPVGSQAGSAELLCSNCGHVADGPNVDALERVAKALILFHAPGPWDGKRAEEWFNLTHSSEATTKGLCDLARVALKKI